MTAAKPKIQSTKLYVLPRTVATSPEFRPSLQFYKLHLIILTLLESALLFWLRWASLFPGKILRQWHPNRGVVSLSHVPHLNLNAIKMAK